MGLEYLPTFTINLCIYVGKYSSFMGHLGSKVQIKRLVFNPSLSPESLDTVAVNHQTYLENPPKNVYSDYPLMTFSGYI